VGIDQIQVKLLDMMGEDRTITDAALTSSGKVVSEERHIKLLEKLIKEGHFSCLEHVVFRFHLKVPIFVCNQIVRHRIASYNVSSARYMFDFNEFYIPDDLDVDQEYIDICTNAVQLYQKFKQSKDKRMTEALGRCLPLSVMTEIVTSINLRSWVNFYNLRSSDHAQLEIRRVAELMLAEIRNTGRLTNTLKFLEIK
jgi:thymidylate synthase (FAD)